MEIATINEKAKQFEDAYKLRSMPIGVKFLEKAADAPQGTTFPLRDMKKHMALCQAFSYARMKGMTIGLTTQDHWCWNPLIGYGNVECKPGQPSFEEVIKFIGIQGREKATEFFMGLETFKKTAGEICRGLRASQKEPGAERIYTAGEKEWLAWQDRKDKGVPVGESIQKELTGLRDRLGLSYRFPFEDR